MRLTSVALALVLAGIAVSATVAALKPEIVEVPGAVVTEGLTVDQHLQRQAELAATLLSELPRASKTVLVPVAPEEIGAIDALDRSISPLKIGFVSRLVTA
jgi:hypothetical protein